MRLRSREEACTQSIAEQQGVFAPISMPSCSAPLLLGGGEGDRHRRGARAQGRVVRRGGTDRVEHAEASARTSWRSARDDGPPSVSLWWLPGVGQETHEEDQVPPAVRAAPFLRWCETCRLRVSVWTVLHSRGVAGARRQACPELREHRAMVRAQEAVGADFGAPPWQPRLEEATNERFGRCRAVLLLGAPARLAVAGAVPIFARFQAVDGEGKPVDGGGEGGEDLGARAG